MTDSIPIGAVVQVDRLPADFETFPEETRAAFRAALGKRFIVCGHGPYGHLELELGRVLDALLGGFMNTIWIEPEYVSVVRSEPPNPWKEKKP
jgi:hypothetical protein